MLVILLAAGCAETEGEDLRAGWHEVECRAGEDEYWEVDMPTLAPVQFAFRFDLDDGTSSWVIGSGSRWDPETEIVKAGSADAVDCRAWIAE